MKLPLTLLSALLIFFAACNSKNRQKLEEVKKVQEAAQQTAIETGEFIQSPVVEISEPAAVYYHPDSAKLVALEQSLGDNFFTAAEESMFEISSSRDYLAKQHIKIVETEARELHFKKSDGSVATIDLRKPGYTWGLFLFNGEADPVRVDMSKPEKQFETYMK